MNSMCLCTLVLSLLFDCGHSNHFGRIYSPEDLLQKNNQEETVRYWADFPVTSPQPKVTPTHGVKLIPKQVTSHRSLQLSNSYSVSGGLPVNNRFRRQTQTRLQLIPEVEQILQRFSSSSSGKIGDMGGNLNFGSIQFEFKDFDALFERFRDSGFEFEANTPSSNLPFHAEISSRQSDNTQQSAPARLKTEPKPIVVTERNTQLAVDKSETSLHSAAPLQERVGERPGHHFPDAPITTDECGIVGSMSERPVPLIHNGKMYQRGELPWLVAIYRIVQNNLIFICGGTLVSDRHVVSAAHCMSRPHVQTPIAEIVIKIGVYGLNDWSDDLTATRKLMAVTIHEDYNTTTYKNDILIFTLNKRVKFTQYIRPACLWSGNTELSRIVGAAGVVAGWGDRGRGVIDNQDEPELVRVPIVSTTECKASKAIFHKLTNENTLCAGDRNGAGPCNGDSGGGLYLLDDGKWRLRGIVSVSPEGENGARVCNLNEYIVYTDTAQFLPWIRNILSEKYFD